MNNPKKNFIYNITYQRLILIIPIITAPYLSRVIGSTGIGTYSYTYSIINYFMLLTMLGVNNYGNRTIAKVRDNKNELSKAFCSMYVMQLVMGILMLILYLAYVFLFEKKYTDISLIQSLFLISAMLDINWCFFGLEEFKKNITRSTFVKICTVILIFLLVKTNSDIWKYALIMSSMTCLSQLILWFYIFKRINIVKIKFKDVLQHIKPNIVLFIPVLAVSLYKIMDKIMLGSLTTVSEVGFYENAEKIVNIPIAIITALGTVMLPRMSNLIAKGEKKQAKEYILKSVYFVMFLSYPMCAGLIGVGYNFATFFFGLEFQKTGILIMLLAITLPFISFANVLRTQYLIPKEMDKVYIKSVFLGAVVNLIMNLVFIPMYDSIGACIGTITAEFAVMFYQAIAIMKELPIKEYVLKTVQYFLKALVMFIIIYPLNYIEMNSLFRLITQVGLGCLIYGLLNIKYIISIVDLKNLKKA